MKHIHIVCPYQSAAMLRMAGPLISELPKLYEVTTSEAPDIEADVNIHIPFHTLVEGELGKGQHFAVYTHCNPNAEPELITACNRADMVIAMSFTGRQELLNFGVDAKKIWVIPCASDGFSYRPRRVLVVGYPQPNGRKRESILLDLAFQFDLTPFEFVLAGRAWEDIAAKLGQLGVKGEIVRPVDDDVLAKFYQTADVLLVTGYMEGGPLPLLEALASGTKVLSPHFGYAADYLDDDCIYDDAKDLMGKLQAMVADSIYYHQLSRSWTWQDYVAEYALLLGRATDTTVDLYPERGMSRYAQILDIIQREKPMSVCEIGTWNGNRAIQMLQVTGKFYPSKRLRYQGFDLFEGQTGEQFTRELSKVGAPLEVVRKRIQATGAQVELVEGDTFDELNHRIDINADLIFVDGGHSEYTVDFDGRVSVEVLNYSKKAVIVFDDYYHAGKPEGVGCNKFIDALNPDVYEITHLPARTETSDGRLIGMVQVKRAEVHIQMQATTSNTTFTLNHTVGN